MDTCKAQSSLPHKAPVTQVLATSVILSADRFLFSFLLVLPQFRCATPMDAHLDKSDLPSFLRPPLHPIFHTSCKGNASKAICCSPGPPAWIPHWWAWHSQPFNNPAHAFISNLLSAPAYSTFQAHRAFSSLKSMICIPPGPQLLVSLCITLKTPVGSSKLDSSNCPLILPLSLSFLLPTIPSSPACGLCPGNTSCSQVSMAWIDGPELL